jgi:hypothetical protein
MKKLFLSLSILLFAGFAGFSQVTFKPGIGISFNDFSESSAGEVKGKVGAQFGGSVAFGKKFYIEPGVFYVTKSSEFTYSESQTTITTADAVIKGIRVPVTVGYGLLGNEKSFASLRVFGGGSGFFVTGVGKDMIKDNVATPTWGIYVGSGVDFWHLFADVSYEWSVTNATKDISNIELGKSRTLFFTVGLRF